MAELSDSATESLHEFRAGLTACLRSWSALRTAVESGWGGAESAQKADDLRSLLLEHFDGKSYPPKKLDQQDLEDNLAIFMEEEFSITLEDGSERQVAETIFRLYESAHKGDSTLARALVAQCHQPLATESSNVSMYQTMEHDDDEDDDDEMKSADIVSHALPEGLTAAEYSAQSLFGAKPKPAPSSDIAPIRQLGESSAHPETPMVDDDGFAPVVGKKKGR